MYPNPFLSDIKIFVNSTSDVMGTFRIIAFDGKEIVNRKLQVQKGDNIVVLKDLGNLVIGNYILEVTTGTDKFIKKIMKN